MRLQDSRAAKPGTSHRRLSEEQIATLLQPYIQSAPIPESLYSALSSYLDLLLRWNARTNLTAVRDPQQIVERHFGESIFAGLLLDSRIARAATLLDFGSGAGFPGLPIQLLLPELRVTLAESQGKKAAFLREAVRCLGIHTEVWAARVEAMPPERRFEVVTARAVDCMQEAMEGARSRTAPRGWLVTFPAEPLPVRSDGGPSADGVRFKLPGSHNRWVALEEHL